MSSITLRFVAAVLLVASPAFADGDEAYIGTKHAACLAKHADPNGVDPECFAAAARCSVLQSSAVCDRLGLPTAEKRVAPRGYYIQGRQ